MKKAVHLVISDFVNDSRVLKETHSLQKQGWQVTVFALHGGKNAQREQINGVEIRRLPLLTRHLPKNFLVQLIKLGEFGLRILPHLLTADVVHCHDVDPLPLGIFAKFLRFGGLSVVYDAHELQTEQPMAKSRRKVMGIVEKFCVRFVDAFVTVSPSISREYAERYQVAPPKLILNCPPTSPVQRRDIFREKFAISEAARIFLYQGGLVPGRGLELLLGFFRTIDPREAVLVVMGSGSLEGLVQQAATTFSAIKYLPAVPMAELLHCTASADVGILSTEADCLNSYYCLPNKFFEYTMAGLAVISNDVPEVRALVERFQNGLVYRAENPETFAQAYQEILKKNLDSYRSGSRALASAYNWENQEKVLLNIYAEL